MKFGSLLFSYFQHHELFSKFYVGLKSLLHQSLSEPEFYVDLVYKFKKIMGSTHFSDQLRKVIIRHKRTGYNLNVIRQCACLVVNPVMVDNFPALFNCKPVDRASDSYNGPDLKLFIIVGWGRSSFVCCLVHWGSTYDLLLLQVSSGVDWQSRDLQLSCNTLYLLSPRLCFFMVLNRDLFVYRDGSLTS